MKYVGSVYDKRQVADAVENLLRGPVLPSLVIIAVNIPDEANPTFTFFTSSTGRLEGGQIVDRRKVRAGVWDWR